MIIVGIIYRDRRYFSSEQTIRRDNGFPFSNNDRCSPHDTSGSSSLGGVAERCSRRRKKGQRPWRRKEVTRISLPLCTRENGISRWPIIFRKGRFWHRGCHSPLPSIPNDRSISQKFYPFIRTREAMLFLCTRYFLIRIAFCRPTWSATLHAMWKKRLSIQLNWIHAPRV